MSNWIRFTNNKISSFGILKDNIVTLYEGDMFNNPLKTDVTLKAEDVTIINPCKPSKMIALWNNYQSLATEKGLLNISPS